jgi:hypothetical protein
VQAARPAPPQVASCVLADMAAPDLQTHQLGQGGVQVAQEVVDGRLPVVVHGWALSAVTSRETTFLSPFFFFCLTAGYYATEAAQW